MAEIRIDVFTASATDRLSIMVRSDINGEELLELIMKKFGIESQKENYRLSVRSRSMPYNKTLRSIVEGDYARIDFLPRVRGD